MPLKVLGVSPVRIKETCEGDLRRMSRTMEPVACGIANHLTHQIGLKLKE